MNAPVWFGWILVVVLAIISGIIFTGKGSFLIAGYNTSNKQEKNRYNKLLLGRVVGGGFGVITVILALLIFFDGELPLTLSWLTPWGILGVIAVISILANTICKRN